MDEVRNGGGTKNGFLRTRKELEIAQVVRVDEILILQANNTVDTVGTVGTVEQRIPYQPRSASAHVGRQYLDVTTWRCPDHATASVALNLL